MRQNYSVGTPKCKKTVNTLKAILYCKETTISRIPSLLWHGAEDWLLTKKIKRYFFKWNNLKIKILKVKNLWYYVFKKKFYCFFNTPNSIRVFKYLSKYLSKYFHKLYKLNLLYETNMLILVACVSNILFTIWYLVLGIWIVRPNSTICIRYSDFLNTQ